MSAWIRVTVIAAAAFALAACAADRDSPGTDPSPGHRLPATVTRVVDGDTIHVDLEGVDTTIRLIGIDTPEVDGPYTDAECYGRQASAYADRTLAGADVSVEFDVERLDRFGRTLAYVWLGSELVNERIVAGGFAVVATFPPNVTYVDRLLAAQLEAREAGRGLWGACPTG